MNLKRAPIFVLLCALVFPGCGDGLRDAAHSLLILGKTVAVLQETAINANQAGLLDRPTTNVIMETTLQISLAGKEASVLTRNYAELPEESRDELLEIIKPAILSVRAAVSDPRISGIKDEGTRLSVEAYLATIGVLLESVRTFLEVTRE